MLLSPRLEAWVQGLPMALMLIPLQDLLSFTLLILYVEHGISDWNVYLHTGRTK